MQRMIGTYTSEGHTIEYSICGEAGEPILVMHGAIPIAMKNLVISH